MRLDFWLVKNGFYKSRERAKEAVSAFGCRVDGKLIYKPAYQVEGDENIEPVSDDIKYVSRAGAKLEAALERFGIDVADKVVLDVGVATGGFTDVLLQKGAKKVYAVDVGKGQLDDNLKNDERVVFMPGTDARDLKHEMFDDSLDLVVVDVSFISVLKILPALQGLNGENTRFVILVKPQFEVGEFNPVVIKDEAKLALIVEKVQQEMENGSFEILQKMESPIRGKEGNKEFLFFLKTKY